LKETERERENGDRGKRYTSSEGSWRRART